MPLGRAVATMRERGQVIDAVVQDMVVRADFSSTSSAQFFDMTTEAISIGYAQMRDVLLPSLDGLLEQRIEHLLIQREVTDAGPLTTGQAMPGQVDSRAGQRQAIKCLSGTMDLQLRCGIFRRPPPVDQPVKAGGADRQEALMAIRIRHARRGRQGLQKREARCLLICRRRRAASTTMADPSIPTAAGSRPVRSRARGVAAMTSMMIRHRRKSCWQAARTAPRT